MRSVKRDMITEERAQYQAEATAEAIEEYLAQSPARGLLNLCKKRGKNRGEVSDVTPGQFRATFGRSPRLAVVNCRGNVPWEYCFDQLATERGVSDGYALKTEIEFALKLRHSLSSSHRSPVHG